MRKIIISLLILCASCDGSFNQNKTIGIIAAQPEELKIISDSITNKKEITIADKKILKGKIGKTLLF